MEKCRNYFRTNPDDKPLHFKSSGQPNLRSQGVMVNWLPRTSGRRQIQILRGETGAQNSVTTVTSSPNNARESRYDASDEFLRLCSTIELRRAIPPFIASQL
jgi:hypothetical protein